VYENVAFCQVATQVSFYVPCLLAQSLSCLSLPVSRSLSLQWNYAYARSGPKDANVPFDSLLRPHRRS